MSWVAAADYRRAGLIASQQQPCHAYGKVEHIDADLMVGAIATGAPGAPHSHIGAKIAVRAALWHLTQNAAEARRAVQGRSQEPARTLYNAAIATVMKRLRAAAFDQVASVRDFATTLTLFAVEPGGLAAMRIGDGLVVARGYTANYESILGGDGTKDVFVTSAQATDAMQVDVREGPVSFICAASDALGALSIRPRDGAPEKRIFHALDSYTRAAPDDSEVHRSIRSFLRSEHVIGRLDEDLGLALCGYRGQTDVYSAAAE